jgi:quinol monooxygenase YgiN
MGIEKINRLSSPVQSEFIRSFLPLTGKSFDTDNRLFVKAAIRLKPEFVDSGRAAIEQIIPSTLQEEGCHLFSLMQDKNDETALHLFEIFEDEAALAYHYEQEYTKGVFANYEQWLAEPIEVHKMKSASAYTTEQLS